MITGVARSGTTLLSECLDHHPNILSFPDPMNELFKGFIQFAYYKVTGKRKPAEYPIDHFFFSGDPQVSQFLNETDFNHEIPDFLRVGLLERISTRGGRFCLSLKETVKACRAQRFDELILEILTLLCDKAPKKDRLYIGFKDAWCEQLLLPLSRSFPNMRFINIIRDPRAVISSNYHSRSKYPLFFSVRDWRKSVYYSWKYRFSSQEMRGKFIYLRYEDLVESPEKTLEKVADFLKVVPSREMLSSQFKKPNSSYGSVTDTQTISYQSKEKWKSSFPEDLRRQVEVYCLPEMEKMGYRSLSAHGFLSAFLCTFSGQQIPYDQLGEWCRKMIPKRSIYSTLWQFMNSGLEFVRTCLYRMDLKYKPSLRKFFYSEEYYQWLKGS